MITGDRERTAVQLTAVLALADGEVLDSASVECGLLCL